MPTSYTTNLRLSNPGLGDTGWGTTASNGMIDLVDPAIAGQASVDVTAAGPFVLTIPDGASGDARNMFIRATGTPGGAREIQVPTNRKLYFVTNDSDGVVTFKVSGQTGVAVPVGASMALRINAAGTDVVQALTYQTTLSIGTITLTSALGAASGGTGQTIYAVGDLLYASGTTALSKLAAVATGNVLRSGGVGTAPAWGQVALATDVTGTLPVGNGGTGQTTQQAAMTALAGAATSGQYLRGNGTNVVMSAIQAADVPTLNQNTTGTASNVTGTVAIANGGTGANNSPSARVNLGATTLGGNLFTIGNVAAISFPQFNADNTVSSLDAASFRTAIGAGTSSTTGTVTSVGGTGTVNGITLSGTVTSSGSLTLGGALSNVSLTTQVTGTLPVGNGGTGATTLTGILKGNGASAFTAATSGVDYAPATSGAAILYGNGSGGFSSVTVGSGLSFAGGTLSATSSGGVTSVTASAPLASSGGATPNISFTGTLAVANGGTGLTSGTSGGVLYYSASSTLASSAALAANSLVVGGGPSGAPSSVTTGTGVLTALAVNTGTAGAFVVNGGALGTPSGGTLTNVTGLPLSTGVTGTLGVSNGGTGQTTAQAAMNALAGGVTSGSYLRGNGANVVMSTIQAADIPTLNQNTTGTAANVTGTVAVANGGTGATTLAANNVLLGNGTSALQVVAPGTNGNVLTSNGTTWQSSTPAAAPVTSVNGLTGAVSMTGLGDIGSYATLIIATNTNVAVDSTVAGSDLRYGWTPNTGPTLRTSFSAFSANRYRLTSTYDGGGTSLSGTWRKVSTGDTYNANVSSIVINLVGCCPPTLQVQIQTGYTWMAALYVRIS